MRVPWSRHETVRFLVTVTQIPEEEEEETPPPSDSFSLDSVTQRGFEITLTFTASGADSINVWKRQIDGFTDWTLHSNIANISPAVLSYAAYAEYEWAIQTVTGATNSSLSTGVAPTITPDFYISTTGNNGDAGTIGAPWAISALADATKTATVSGKVVQINDGTYRWPATGWTNGNERYACAWSHVILKSETLNGAIFTTEQADLSYPTDALNGGIGASNGYMIKFSGTNVLLHGAKFIRTQCAAINNRGTGLAIRRCWFEDLDGERGNSYGSAHDNFGAIRSINTNQHLYAWDCYCYWIRGRQWSTAPTNRNLWGYFLGPMYNTTNWLMEQCTAISVTAGIYSKRTNGNVAGSRNFVREAASVYQSVGYRSLETNGPLASGLWWSAGHVTEFANNIGVNVGSLNAQLTGESLTEPVESFIQRNNTLIAVWDRPAHPWATYNYTANTYSYGDVQMHQFYNNLTGIWGSGNPGLSHQFYTYQIGTLGGTMSLVYSVHDYNLTADAGTSYFGLLASKEKSGTITYIVNARTAGTTGLAQWQAGTGFDTHSVVALDQKFKNASGTGLLAADYKLMRVSEGDAETSPAVDVGSSNGQTSGTATDIGAWQPGVYQIGSTLS